MRHVMDLVRAKLRSPTVRLLSVNVVVLGLGLVSSAQLARGLGVAGRGELAAAMLWPSLLAYLFSLGQKEALVYFAGRPGFTTGTLFGTATVFALVQGALAVAIGYVALPVLLLEQDPSVVAASREYLWMIPAAMLSTYGLSMLQARMQFTAFSALTLILPLGYVIGVAALSSTGSLTPRTAILLQLVLNGFVLVGTALCLWALRVVSTVRVDLGTGRQMLKYGAKVQAGDMSQLANLRLDQTLMAAWFPPAQLGIYVAAVSASSVSQVLSTAVRTVLMPRVANSRSESGASQLVRETFRKYWLYSVLGTVFLALGLPFLIPLVFGPEFGAAVLPALVLLIANLFLGAKHVMAGAAQALGRAGLASWSEISSLGVTLVLLPLLLPTLGVMGAALASLAAYATQFLIVFFGLARHYDLSVRSLMFGGATARGTLPRRA